jgi:hypothetical protein
LPAGVIVAFESDRALAALPALLRDPADRAWLLTLLERLATDPRVWKDRPAPDQIEMLAHPNGPRCRGTEGPRPRAEPPWVAPQPGAPKRQRILKLKVKR